VVSDAGEQFELGKGEGVGGVGDPGAAAQGLPEPAGGGLLGVSDGCVVAGINPTYSIDVARSMHHPGV
jgi:hypothetical protein